MPCPQDRQPYLPWRKYQIRKENRRASRLVFHLQGYKSTWSCTVSHPAPASKNPSAHPIRLRPGPGRILSGASHQPPLNSRSLSSPPPSLLGAGRSSSRFSAPFIGCKVEGVPRRVLFWKPLGLHRGLGWPVSRKGNGSRQGTHWKLR